MKFRILLYRNPEFCCCIFWALLHEEMLIKTCD
jgi:hypothetical protein